MITNSHIKGTVESKSGEQIEVRLTDCKFRGNLGLETKLLNAQCYQTLWQSLEWITLKIPEVKRSVIFYVLTLDEKGALLCVRRERKRKANSDVL